MPRQLYEKLLLGTPGLQRPRPLHVLLLISLLNIFGELYSFAQCFDILNFFTLFNFFARTLQLVTMQSILSVGREYKLVTKRGYTFQAYFINWISPTVLRLPNALRVLKLRYT